MISLLKSLKEPFPCDPSVRNHLEIASFFGVFVFAFLFLFKPFGLGTFPASKIPVISAGYALVTFCCIFLLNRLIHFLFPRYFNEQSWTTGKQIFIILLVIFFVGLTNYLISPLLVDSPLSLYYLFWFQGITIGVAVLPVSMYFLIRQNRLLKKFKEEARDLEEKLSEKIKNSQKKTEPENDNIDAKLILTGDNQGEKMEFYPDDLYVLTAASNYIKLFHLEKEKLVYSILRSTLKKTGEIVLNNSKFFKCHRAFIVNLDKVVHVEGNAQGYKIKIENYDDLIPVSRNLNSEFSDKLLAFRKV